MIYTLTLNPAVDKEYSVPRLVLDEVLRAVAVRVDYGGKGFNVARMLAALGARSLAVGLVGGRAGELLRDGLASLGIETEFIWIEGETRTNVSIVTGEGDHYVKVNEAGPIISADETDRLMDTLQRLVQPGDWWVLSGSLPPGVPAGLYARIITALQAGGAQAVLDTSGPALALACGARPFLVKPNASEAGGLTGQPVGGLAELSAAAQRIHRLGPLNVAISAGKDGALLSDGRRAWFGYAPHVEERNPIGAGDAMLAGLVWRLALGDPLPAALPWGIACGAATAAQPGTAVGPPALVEALAAQTTIEEMAYAI